MKIVSMFVDSVAAEVTVYCIWILKEAKVRGTASVFWLGNVQRAHAYFWTLRES